MGEPVPALLDPDCRGGNHAGCVGPPGTTCECPCHTATPPASERVSGDPYVREVGRVQDIDGYHCVVGVEYDTVTIATWTRPVTVPLRLTQDQAGEFARLFVSAVWQAGQQKRQLAEEVYEADGGDTHHDGGEPGG